MLVVGGWLSVCCHGWILLAEHREEKKHQDLHFYQGNEYMRYTETMSCCCLGGRRIYMPSFVLADGPRVHFCSSGRWSLTDGNMKDGRQLDNWVEIQCGIPGMLQKALWVQSHDAINANASGPPTHIQSSHKNDFPTVACDSFHSHNHARQNSALARLYKPW